MQDTEAMNKLRDLIKDGKTGLLSSIDDGKIVTRPMALQSTEFDGDMWFFTGASSDKVQEIAANSKVNVAFESGNSWVSVAGTAETIDDRQKAEELWNPIVKAYFPGGLDDPQLRLIKVHAETAEYWDTNNKVVSLFKMAKAAATDTTPDMGENKTLEL